MQVSSLMILCQRDENQFLVNCAPRLFEPIELTDELLVKIGFVKIEFVKNEQYEYYKKICIDNYSYMLEFIVVSKDEYTGLKITRAENEDDGDDYYSTIFYNDNIKHIHQLQNAYYITTDRELKILL